MGEYLLAVGGMNRLKILVASFVLGAILFGLFTLLGGWEEAWEWLKANVFF
jgi:hypothetical protein